MTYLARVCFKVPIRILWVKFHVFREGVIAINAGSDLEAVKKMEAYEKENRDVHYYTISRSL